MVNDTVAPATQVEPLQLLLAASMMVQRLRQYASTLQGCCRVCTHHATAINTILDEFVNDTGSGSGSNKSNIKVGETV